MRRVCHLIATLATALAPLAAEAKGMAWVSSEKDDAITLIDMRTLAADMAAMMAILGPP